ncbi:MAG: hypothetical protein KDC35_09965, partial [Acidobacteria bacterium]|nr:hypothetical protein [Acidobacteriota bacterium]
TATHGFRDDVDFNVWVAERHAFLVASANKRNNYIRVFKKTSDGLNLQNKSTVRCEYIGMQPELLVRHD